MIGVGTVCSEPFSRSVSCCHRNNPETHNIARKPWQPRVIRLMTQHNGFLPLHDFFFSINIKSPIHLVYQWKERRKECDLLVKAQSDWNISTVARNIFLNEGLNCLSHRCMSSVQIQHWPGGWRWPDVSIEVVHRRQQLSPPDRLNSPWLLLCGCNPVSFARSHVFSRVKQKRGKTFISKAWPVPVSVCLGDHSGSLAISKLIEHAFNLFESAPCAISSIFSLQWKDVPNLDCKSHFWCQELGLIDSYCDDSHTPQPRVKMQRRK